MDFDLSDEQQMLEKTARDYAKKDSTVARFRKLREESELGWDRETYASFGELGWLGVAFPENLGGFGGDIGDASVIVRQLAKSLVPEPISAAIVAGKAIEALGSDAQKQTWLSPLIEGSKFGTLAWAERSGRFNPARIETTATLNGDAYRLRGTKPFVLEGHAADFFVVSALVGEELGLFVVNADEVSRQTRTFLDGHKGASLTIDTNIPADRRLGGDASAALADVLEIGASLTVAEGLGVAESMLWMTVEYLKTRKQFGVKIGSFQALQHRAVEMFVETELLKSIQFECMGRASEPGVERTRAIHAAKIQLATGGLFIARESVQLHGGVGVTDEHDIGLFFKRLHVLSALFGDEAYHTRRYAQIAAEA